jgi:hypothetical protein
MKEERICEEVARRLRSACLNKTASISRKKESRA